jgi:hypothetical protein
MSVGAGIISLQQNERKTKMGRMKELYTQILECDTCYGKGWLYYGDENNYDVEACQCNPLSFFQENK